MGDVPNRLFLVGFFRFWLFRQDVGAQLGDAPLLGVKDSEFHIVDAHNGVLILGRDAVELGR